MKVARHAIAGIGCLLLGLLFLVTLVLSYFDDEEEPDGMA